MKVKSLEITIPSYGDEAGRYIGQVSLEGDRGKQELRLSPGAIGRIFSVIQAEVSDTAKFNAKQVSAAVENAANEVALIGVIVEAPL